MRKDPTPAPFLKEALTFATFEPGLYEVVVYIVASGFGSGGSNFDGLT